MGNTMRFILLGFCFFIFVSCSQVIPQSDPSQDLASFFDCVRENNGALVSAHRGGPRPGYAENSLPTFQHTAKGGLVLLEVDVRKSADGVLFLLHDDTLDRTSTGRGPVKGLSWSALERFELLDENGKKTGAHIPDLASVLRWAKSAPVVLQLDIKGRARFFDIAKAVRKASMSQRVMLITYNEKQAYMASKHAPGVALSVSIDSLDDYDRLIANGIDARQIIAWTGTGAIKPLLYKALSDRGVENIYGALGRTDRRAARTGGPGVYRNIIGDGVHIIATDRAAAVRRALKADDRAERLCALPEIKA